MEECPDHVGIVEKCEDGLVSPSGRRFLLLLET